MKNSFHWVCRSLELVMANLPTFLGERSESEDIEFPTWLCWTTNFPWLSSTAIPFPFWPFTWKIRHVSFHSESFHCGNKLRPRVSFSFKPSSVTSNLERSAEPRWPWISTVHSVHSTSAMVGVYKSLAMGWRRECTCQCACVECQPDWLHKQCYKNIN